MQQLFAAASTSKKEERAAASPFVWRERLPFAIVSFDYRRLLLYVINCMYTFFSMKGIARRIHRNMPERGIHFLRLTATSNSRRIMNKFLYVSVFRIRYKWIDMCKEEKKNRCIGDCPKSSYRLLVYNT